MPRTPSQVSLPRRAWRTGMRLQRRVAAHLPPVLASRVSLPGRWYKAFNRQTRRREIVEEIASVFSPDVVIETGTWRGATTRALFEIFRRPVATVEADPRYHAYAERHLAELTQVHLSLADSRVFLDSLTRDPVWSGRAFFYLDAHWEQDLPLQEELQIIAAAWPESVILIDDFEVPGDPGYGYDDYGSEVGALTARILPAEIEGWHLLYPAARATSETGARQGCCVLWSPKLQLPELLTLRVSAAPGKDTEK